MIGIYKITSPSGKIYIGQSININKRWDNHKRHSGIGPKLKNSYIKHGFDFHIKEIIEECSIEQLNEKEIYWKQIYINKYGWKKMLFCEIYDSGGGPKSEETKNKQSQGLKQAYNTGKKQPVWKDKKRPGHSKYMKENSGFKYKRTPEHEYIKSQAVKKVFSEKGKEIGKKISKGKIGKGTKSIQCIETNEIFNSIKECSEKTGISKGCICNFLKGKYNYPTLRGLTFKYFKKDFYPQPSLLIL